VVCFGNICRSPYAAAILSREFDARGVRTAVHQGGFIGPDRRAPETARVAAEARGVDLGTHRSRLVTPDLARRARLIIVMESRQAARVAREFGAARARLVVLGDLDPEPIASRDIPDPYGMSLDTFATTYARIDRCVAALAGVVPRS